MLNSWKPSSSSSSHIPVLSQTDVHQPILSEETKKTSDMNPATLFFSNFGKQANDLLTKFTGVLLPKTETKPNGVIFSEFGKQADDILMKGYYNEDMEKDLFTLGTHSKAEEVDFTLSTLLKQKKNINTSNTIHGATISDLTATYKSKNNKKNSIHFKINAEPANNSNNGFSTTTQVQYELVPDIMNGFMSLAYPLTKKSAKIGLQCYNPDACLNFTAASTLGDQLPILEGSGVFGTKEFAVGGEVVVDTKIHGMDYRAGIRHTNSIFDMSVIVSDTMKVSCLHPLNLKKKSYLVAEFQKNMLIDEEPMTLTVGTSFEVNHPWKEKMKTVVKAKLDNHGKMGVVLQQQLIKDKMLQICSECDTIAFNKTPRIAVSICSTES